MLKDYVPPEPSAKLDRNLILSQLNSADQFPIDFDDAWKWLGYSQKSKALLTLKANFIEGQDFLSKGVKTLLGGRPSESFYLTVRCFKKLCMLTRTRKGDEVRDYYLDVEDEWRELKNQERDRLLQEAEFRVLQAVEQSHAEIERLKAVNKGQRQGDRAIKAVKTLLAEHPIVGRLVCQEIAQLAGIQASDSFVNTEEHAKAMEQMSLAANRLGLAFNKHFKVAELGVLLTDPKKVAELRTQCISLSTQVVKLSVERDGFNATLSKVEAERDTAIRQCRQLQDLARELQRELDQQKAKNSQATETIQSIAQLMREEREAESPKQPPAHKPTLFLP